MAVAILIEFVPWEQGWFCLDFLLSSFKPFGRPFPCWNWLRSPTTWLQIHFDLLLSRQSSGWPWTIPHDLTLWASTTNTNERSGFKLAARIVFSTSMVVSQDCRCFLCQFFNIDGGPDRVLIQRCRFCLLAQLQMFVVHVKHFSRLFVPWNQLSQSQTHSLCWHASYYEYPLDTCAL